MRTLLTALFVVGLTAVLLTGCGDTADDDHTSREIGAWIADLDASEIDDRFRAGLMLARYGEAAVPALAARLGRDAALDLTQRGDPDADGEPRRIAAETLAMIGAPAIPALLDALTLDSQYERALAQQALTVIGLGTEHAPRLIELMGHENNITAGMAAHLIGTLPTARSALLTFLAQAPEDETHVRRALLSIHQIDGDTPETMTPFLTHTSVQVRREALHVLRLVGATPEQAATVATMLGEEDAGVRSWAATLLRKLGPKALYSLIDVARDGTGRSAQLALGLIGELGSAALGAVPIVKARMADSTPVVRAAAAEALHGITGVEDDARPVLLAAARSGDASAQVLAVAALGGFEEGTEEIVAVLVPLLDAADGELARIAADSLGHMGPKAAKAEQALVRASSSLDANLARAATQALEHVRGEHGD